MNIAEVPTRIHQVQADARHRVGGRGSTVIKAEFQGLRVQRMDSEQADHDGYKVFHIFDHIADFIGPEATGR